MLYVQTTTALYKQCNHPSRSDAKISPQYYSQQFVLTRTNDDFAMMVTGYPHTVCYRSINYVYPLREQIPLSISFPLQLLILTWLYQTEHTAVQEDNLSWNTDKASPSQPHINIQQGTQRHRACTYATVMQASLTTWDLRSLADSLKAPSNSRKCWKNPSYWAAPATSKDRTFFS